MCGMPSFSDVTNAVTRSAADVVSGGLNEALGNPAGKGAGNLADTISGKKNPVSTPPAPGTPGAQSTLEQEQTDILQQQQELINGFKPFVLKQYGIVETKDPTTGASSYSYTPEQQALNDKYNAIQGQNLDLQTQKNQRVSDALNGKIGPSDFLTNQEGKDFAALKESQGSLGNEIIGDTLETATAKSTSGIQALQALQQTYGSLKSQEINSIINGDSPGSYTAAAKGSVPTSATSGLASTFDPLQALGSSFGNPFQPYEYQTGLTQQNNEFGSNAQNSFTNTILTGLLGIGGQAARGYVGRGA